MALAVAYQTTVTFTTTAALYTTSSTSLPGRDLVITNSGAGTCYVACGAPTTAAVTTSSFVIPTGGSVVLTQCQIPASLKIWGCQDVATNTQSVSIGYASVVSVI